MKTIARFLLSSAILGIALTPLILLAVWLANTHPSGGWWFGVLLGGAAEWYRLVENHRKAWVERLLPKSSAPVGRSAFLDRSVLHWRN